MKNGGKCRRYFLSVSRSGQRKIAKKPFFIPYLLLYLFNYQLKCINFAEKKNNLKK